MDPGLISKTKFLIHIKDGTHLALLSGLRIWGCRELWCRSQMRLRSGIAVAHRLAALALIRPLAWEPPYVSGVAVKRQKKIKKKKKKEYALEVKFLPAKVF